MDGMSKTKKLIAYFSRAGKNYAGGNIINLSVGNTEVAAKIIRTLTGGDIFKIDTILEEYDLSGKTIAPFCTHEGSRMGRSEKDIRKLCPNSRILEGLPILGAKVEGAEKKIMDWLKKVGEIE
jgi:flavodoxin